MATFTTSVAEDARTSDAVFRAFLKMWHDGFTGIGWVRAADTGQLDYTTATMPNGTVNNQQWGYILYETPPGVTPPLKCRISWSSQNALNTTNAFFTVVQFGAASNGTGTLTGVVSPAWTYGGHQNNPTPSPCYWSGSATRLTAAIVTETNPHLLIAERLRDATGAETTDGWWVSFTGGVSAAAGGQNNLVLPASGTLPVVETSYQGPFTAAPTTVRGTNVFVFPIFPVLGGALNPAVGVQTYRNGDITTETIFPTTLYGTPRQYLALRNLAGTGGGANPRLAMLWE